MMVGGREERGRRTSQDRVGMRSVQGCPLVCNTNRKYHFNVVPGSFSLYCNNVQACYNCPYTICFVAF